MVDFESKIDVQSPLAPLNTLGTSINIVGNKPEPLEPPTPTVAVVEEAKVFAAAVVRPEPTEEVMFPAALVEKAVVTESAAFPVSNMLDVATLTKIVDSPELAEALAAEGLVVDKEEITRAIEQDKQRAKLEAVVHPSASYAASYVNPVPEEELVDVTPETFRDLKVAVNASFEELAGLVLEQQRQIDEIEARLTAFNRRGGHKI